MLTLPQLKERLGAIYPEFEIEAKWEIAQEIIKLKKERNAIVLGHNYMEPVLFHTIPDFVGDSLELSRVAARTEADVIVFCGVEFMAESAKILNPSKTVLIPSNKAGCSLADGITAEDVRKLKAQYPGVPVVTYINTYADVKAETDICCTSGNAVAVVNSLESDSVIFLPDEYLARNIAIETGKNIILPKKDGGMQVLPSNTMVGWSARCEVHERYTVSDIENVRKLYPDVVVVSHPECSPEVVAASDFAGSTTAMINYVATTDAPRYLVLTECSMGDILMAQYPHKEFVRMCTLRCPHMNQITMEDTLNALKHNQYEVTIDEDIRLRALGSLERMIAIGHTGKKD